MTHIAQSRTELPMDSPPDQIAAALFADAGQLFACLDANRIRNLPVILEASGLPHSCLFQGLLAEDAADAAPWLVALTPGDRLTRNLLTSAGGKPSGGAGQHPFAFWEAEAGIFLKSTMTLAELRQHLRRFLRVRSMDERLFFFRFWEPAATNAYFTGINDRPDLIRRWFISREGKALDEVITARPGPDGPRITRLRPVDLTAQTEPQGGPFSLTQSDVQRLVHLRMEQDAHELAHLLRDTFPAHPGTQNPEALHAFTSRALSRMMDFGFRKKSSLFMLLAWELHYGPGFETRDHSGALAMLLTQTGPEAERLTALEARITALEDLGIPSG